MLPRTSFKELEAQAFMISRGNIVRGLGSLAVEEQMEGKLEEELHRHKLNFLRTKDPQLCRKIEVLETQIECFRQSKVAAGQQMKSLMRHEISEVQNHLIMSEQSSHNPGSEDGSSSVNFQQQRSSARMTNKRLQKTLSL